eukprot:2086911-Pyramimonas_sp.AAC.1
MAAQQPITVIEEITSRKEEGTEDGPGDDQQPAASQPGPSSGGNIDEIAQGPEQHQEVKCGGKKHSVKKVLRLKQTKTDDAHDDRAC